MRRPVLLIAAVSALVLAGTAVAGGWATVKLSSRPTGLAAGETWIVDITVLQHGVTPLPGVRPTLTIRKVQRTLSSVTRTFSTRATGRTGVYRARVVFPSAGRWRYEVYDGFTQYGGARTHSFAAVTIARAGT
jgi:hypothetical protein